MSERETRKEILDLLARGKISIDEAVSLLDQSEARDRYSGNDEPLYKAEMVQRPDAEEIEEIKFHEASVSPEHDVQKTMPEVKRDGNGKQPRWLRVQVVDTRTGKNKVMVNIPFGMVKFGMGIASVFSPEIRNVDLEDVSEIFNQAEPGLLVDVQDDEDNEHVRVFFE